MSDRRVRGRKLGEAAGAEARTINAVCLALERAYGSPRHGNKTNPLDELIFIILSNRTTPRTHSMVYAALKTAFPTWNSVRAADRRTIRRVLEPAGLSRLRADQIIRIVRRLRLVFGRATLAPLRAMRDGDAEAFLTALPGVGRKVAKCVLMYSLNRHVLPVDVHVHRIAKRLGLTVKKRPDTSQDLVEAAVPAPLRYGFHVNAVAHGRSTCRPANPRCSECCISRWCPSRRSEA
jgi:endonuclease III